MPILEWLTSINRCMITPNICVEVGLEGALDTLIWLKEAGHPWRDGVWGALEGGMLNRIMGVDYQAVAIDQVAAVDFIYLIFGILLIVICRTYRAS